MNDQTIARVQYFEKQFLRTADFIDEQSYHLAMRRRHNIAHHTWGIVRGLVIQLEESGPVVLPGIAIDIFGRELVLAEKTPVPGSAFDAKGSDVLDAWLVYERVASDEAPPGYAGCGSGSNGRFYRWQERGRLRLERPDPAFPDRRQPKGVLPADEQFNASLVPPDDPERAWPVFLGQVTRVPANKDQPYSVDLSGRPYAGLVAGSIVAPSRRATVQIGAERADDPNRFAVFVPEGDEETAPEIDPRLAVRSDGEVRIAGDTTITGQLTVSAGSVTVGAGATEGAQPWRIYRTSATESQLQNELRIEMQGGTLGSNRVVIGAWSEQEKKFKPCVTIADDSSVTVHGNLVVEGLISAASFTPGKLTPEAEAFVTGTAFGGVGASSNLLGRFYRRNVPPQRAPVDTIASISGPSVEAIAARLSDQATLDRFVKAVKDAGLKDKLVEGLEE